MKPGRQWYRAGGVGEVQIRILRGCLSVAAFAVIALASASACGASEPKYVGTNLLGDALRDVLDPRLRQQ